MSNKKTILIISRSTLSRDPRVNRQIRFLMDQYNVVTAGLGESGLDVPFIPLKRWEKQSLFTRVKDKACLLAHRFEEYYWRQYWVKDALENLKEVNADVVIANDMEMLPLGLKVANGAPVIYDAHEYHPLLFEEYLKFRIFEKPYFTYIMKKYIPQTAAMMTVTPGFVPKFEAETGVTPQIVWNAPDYEELEPSPISEDGIIRMIYHGYCQRTREIERVIEMMDYLDERFELSLMLTKGGDYLQELKMLAAGNSQICFLDPVPMEEISKFTNQFDIGLFLLPPNSFQRKHALPNKFFEFVQARLAIAIGPSPDMADLLQEHELGIVSTDFTAQSLAEKLNALSNEQIMQFKQNANRSALFLSAETGRERLASMVESVLPCSIESKHPLNSSF